MAGGVNHAKRIVLEEVTQLGGDAEELAKDLQNGKGGDLHTISKALVLVVKTSTLTSKMIAPLYAAELVTIQECHRQHEALKAGQQMKIKVGPFAFEGHFNPTVFLSLTTLTLLGALFFTVGKIEHWW